MWRPAAPSSDRQVLIERYRRQPEELAQVVLRPPPAGTERLPGATEWSDHQLVAHIRDVEHQAYLPRLERILSEAGPRFEDFDAERWMMEHYHQAESVEDLLAGFASARTRGLELIDGLSDAGWLRAGTHPETGPRTFEWWLARSVEHADEHIAQLARRRAAAS